MIIKRSKTFSDKKKDSTARNIKLATGGGLLVGGKELERKLGIHENIKADSAGITDNLLDENRNLLKKMDKAAKKQKTLIEGHNRSAYREKISDEFKKNALTDLKINKELLKNKYKYMDTPMERRIEDSNRHINKFKRILKSKDRIALGIDENGIANGADLAHELGHSQHYHGRGGSRIGKLAHKIMDTENKAVRKLNEKISPVQIKMHHIERGAGVLAGLASGINAGKKEKEGKKEGLLSKTAWITTPVISRAPTLISEGEATRQGLKMLKKAGASKAYMGMARKNLGHAFGTYAAGLIAPIAMGYGARQIGKVIGRRIAKNKGPKNSGENNEKRV